MEKAIQNVEYLAQYALTQYTLAPLIVRNSPELPLVVGNFLDGPPAPGFLEKNGLVPLKDFGDGLILYEGTSEAMIFFFGASLLLSLIIGVLLTLVFLSVPENGKQPASCSGSLPAAVSGSASPPASISSAC